MVSIPRWGCQGKPFHIVLRIIGTKIIKKQKRVKNGHFTESKNPLQVNAGPFNRRLALEDFPNFSS